MKRLTKLTVFLVLLAILCPILAGCALGGSDTSDEPSVAYGKQYVYEYENSTTNERSYYVFNEDYTGYYQRHYESHSGTSTFIYSGRADFIWRAADDGSVYLFQTKVTYDEDDNSESWGVKWGVGALPLSFADEFVIVMNSNGTVTRFVLEGSDLEKSLNEE